MRAERRQLILFHPEGFSALDPATGKVFWEIEHRVQMGIVVATPVHSGRYLFFTSQHGGARMLALDEHKPSAAILWSGPGEQDPGMTHDTPDTVNSVIGTPVIDGEYVYALDNDGQLRCLSAATGKLVWKTDALLGEHAMYGTAFFVKNGDRYFINNDRGELVTARLSPKGFAEISRTKLIEPTTRTSAGVSSPTCSGRTPPTPTGTSSSGTTTRSSVIRWPPDAEMPSRLLWPGLAVTVALTSSGGGAGKRVAQPAGQRAVVVLSDLHMGAGRDESGRWRREEDFRWAPEFSEFLRAIDAQHRSSVDLVLNGDTFDLPRAEAEALASLDRVLPAHTAERQALAAFATRGTNHVVLIPGDRDSALRLAKVAERVVSALQGSADRVAAASAGYWVSADGKVHAEHGHDIRLRGQDSGALQELYDRLEAVYPSVDNVAVIGSGAKYALAADNTLASGDAAALVVRDSLLNVSWQQFRMELDDGEVQPPRWDLDASAQAGIFAAAVGAGRRRSAEAAGGDAGLDWRPRSGRRRPDRSGNHCALRLSGRRAARQAALRAGGDAVRAARAGRHRMFADAGYSGRHLRLLLAIP